MFAFSCDSCCSFGNNFIFSLLKLIILISCLFKDSQTFFMQASMLLYLLLSMLLNEDIVDIEKPDEICSLTFVVHEISGLFLQPSIFSIIDSKFA